MISLRGYRINEKIFESPSSLVYKGLRETDHQAVILKVLKEDYPSRQDLIRYRQEFEITRHLELKGVIQAFAQEKYGNSLAIILEDFGGLSLKILQAKRKFSTREILKLGIRIAETLGEIHAANVIHKDINPSNIIFNPETNYLKIIDFGVSTRLSREILEVNNPENLEGTLPYMSPEQTGRMNRALDYRTDFYAFGASIFELLTGRLPFEYEDAMEMVHAHLAKEPISPSILNENISPNLEKIILKLLAKRAEDRYQSSYGLVQDLKSCLHEIENGIRDTDFIPGQKDLSERFTLPQKLYGRERELQILLRTAERCATGDGEVLFISGYSGVGKSALIKELYKPLAMKNGYFISGKFNQYRRNIPYSAVQSAFQDLLRQLMTESKSNIMSWKTKIRNVLGANGRVLTDFLPELKKIIDEQKPLPRLDPTAAHNRFNRVFQNFVRLFCTVNHPLVIFLDDLQWADSASLQFVELMMKQGRHIFLLGAYRDNEVNEYHPLFRTLDNIRISGTPLETIRLQPLLEKDVRHYLVDLTGVENENTEALVRLVLEKTSGNPFFMGELLSSLYRDNILKFDTLSGTWICEPAQLLERNISNNVVDFMARRIEEMEQVTRAVLSRAACLGNVFDIKTLSLIYQKSIAETAADLWPALADGLVLPLKNEYKIAGLHKTDAGDLEGITYKFSHDRIQEAAYSLIPLEARPITHLKAGRLLLYAADESEREHIIFEIVDHLNMGLSLLENQIEADELAKLNLDAGQKAQASTAYGPALTYYQTGLKLLGNDNWERSYKLTLQLSIQGAESAYLGQNTDVLEFLVAEILLRARNYLDKVRAYEIQILASQTRNDFSSGINIALDVLKKLKVHLPENPGKLHLLFPLLYIKWKMARTSANSILNAPSMENQNARAASRILSTIASSTYISRPNLFPLVVIKMIQLSLKYGNSVESPFALATYGIIQTGVLSNTREGYKIGKLALNLVEKLKVDKIKPRVSMVYYSLLSSWNTSARYSIAPLTENLRFSLDMGDQEYYGFNTLNLTSICFHTGRELEALEKQAAEYSRILKELTLQTPFEYVNIYRQVIQILRDSSLPVQGKPVSELIQGPIYDEELSLSRHEQANDKTALFFLYLSKLMLSCLFQENALGLQFAEQAVRYIDAVPGQTSVAVYYFYDSLVHLADYQNAKQFSKKQIRKRIKHNQKKLLKWSNHTPLNNQHRFHLIAAEEARVQQRPEQARIHYEQAAELAREYEYTNDEALIWEMAGRFYLEEKADEFAGFCLKNSHYAYSIWGARAKVEWLEKQYPWLTPTESHTSRSNRVNISLKHGNTGNSGRGPLDLLSILKASRAIAGEMYTAGLMQKLMSVVLENTGAGEGYLIIQKNSRFLVEAHARADTKAVELLESFPLEQAEDLPGILIAYVIRTEESLVLEDAATNELFREDPVITRRRPRSILCAPILFQGQITGIIYLENNLANGVFTPERLEVLRLLSAQIAVSLKNALDYEELRQANHVKGIFLNKMSTELRTPLNNILGLADRILKDKETIQRNKEFAGGILDSSGRLSHFVDNLLDLNKSGDIKNIREEFHLMQFLEMLAYIYRKRSEEKNVRFNWNPTLPFPEKAIGDRHRLEQILINLLDNAVKYTTRGEIIFSVVYKESKLLCEIKDTGPGITQEKQQQIFSPFQRSGSGLQTSEGKKITGLGLTVSKKLTDDLGGELILISSPEKGTLINLNIPLETEPGKQLSEGPPSGNKEDLIIAPPHEKLIEVHDLAKSGDIIAVMHYSDDLDKISPEYSAFTGEIRRLAQGFQERKLREFIEKHM